MTVNTESLVLGGGCFWCLEAAYQQLNGVLEVLPGYAGGSVPNPTYEQVCMGTTGHVEVVKITFDPRVISLKDIMAVFWTIHDPTSLNRQGGDVGTQYASVAFYSDDEQHQALLDSQTEAQRYLEAPIVTSIQPLEAFYVAEPEHQNYYEKHPEAAYCQVVIEPKLSKLRDHFARLIQN